MSAYFVTATGTDIGKTFVTAGLIRAARLGGLKTQALKPIVSGIDDANPAGSDPAVLLDALGETVTPETLARISPWRFAAPMSPDMAAAREERFIPYNELLETCRDAVHAARDGMLFIEGVGGVMVPLDARRTVLDWMADMRLPLILVAGSYLGTISHTLTAMEVVARARLKISALVINESEGATIPLEETLATLRRFAGVPIATIPRGGDMSAFAKLASLL
ncbi:MAG: dethiobiotin synthase [Proteobacteria bacterium]|nr:dethiobiotin synthase [Pseudomonadota bacterium]